MWWFTYCCASASCKCFAISCAMVWCRLLVAGEEHDRSFGYRSGLKRTRSIFLDAFGIHAAVFRHYRGRYGTGRVRYRGGLRSEEHTSELQSLMRISYAVFCLKKKKTINTK